MNCFPEVQDWLSSSLRPVNHPEEPDSCWPGSTVPCCLPALWDGPARGAQWRWQPQGGHCLLWHGTVPLQSLAWELSSFAGRAPDSSSARSWDGGQVKALGQEEEEVGGSASPCQAAAPLSLVSDLMEARIFPSPSIPNGTKLLLLLVFVLTAPWSYALIIISGRI